MKSASGGGHEIWAPSGRQNTSRTCAKKTINAYNCKQCHWPTSALTFKLDDSKVDEQFRIFLLSAWNLWTWRVGLAGLEPRRAASTYVHTVSTGDEDFKREHCNWSIAVLQLGWSCFRARMLTNEWVSEVSSSPSGYVNRSHFTNPRAWVTVLEIYFHWSFILNKLIWLVGK